MLNTVILKAVSPCNINCTYCYEYNRGDASWKARPKRANVDIARQLGTRLNEHATTFGKSHLSVNLHGGEPTLLGAKGLREVLSTIRESAPDTLIRFGIQTNATLITESILDVLEEFQVSVGISLDGNESHNGFRVDHKGAPTYARVLKGIDKVKSRKGLFAGLLAVVNLDADPKDVLDALASFSPPQIDLLPPFGNFDNPPQNLTTKFTLGTWMTRAFDCWTASERMQAIDVRYLKDALYAVVSGESNSDWFALHSPGYLIVSTDGQYEGLDGLKIVGDFGRRLGCDVFSTSISEALSHEFIAMRQHGLEGLSKTCQECSIVNWCGGGHLPTRFGRGNGYLNPSYYCDELKLIFKHIARWVIDQPEVDQTTKDRIKANLDGLLV